MRIEVLGAVRAWRGDQELPLGTPQQRGLLAMLALAEGQPVQADEIITALWGGRPPTSADNVVHTYIRRLRRVLEPDRPARQPSRLLPRLGAGYAIRAAPDQVDLWRFRRLIGTARQAGQPGRSSPQVFRILQEAMRLWRGPPAADLPGLVDEQLIRVATEEHGAALAWYAEAALACRDGVTEALPVLVQAAGAEPFDERLQAQLIRLYHAAGRRADALRVYRRSRICLRDELGVEPGPELATAYRTLLRDRTT